MLTPWVWVVLITIVSAAYLCLPFRRIPDAPLLLLAFGFYSFYVDLLPWFFWLPIVLLVVVMAVADFFLDRWMRRQTWHSRAACWISLMGVVLLVPILLPFVSLFALVLGPFLAVLLAECWLEKKSLREAGRVGLGTTLGFALPLMLKAVVMAGMVAFFASLALAPLLPCVQQDKNSLFKVNLDACYQQYGDACAKLQSYGLDKYLDLECPIPPPREPRPVVAPLQVPQAVRELEAPPRGPVLPAT